MLVCLLRCAFVMSTLIQPFLSTTVCDKHTWCPAVVLFKLVFALVTETWRAKMALARPVHGVPFSSTSMEAFQLTRHLPPTFACISPGTDNAVAQKRVSQTSLDDSTISIALNRAFLRQSSPAGLKRSFWTLHARDLLSFERNISSLNTKYPLRLLNMTLRAF